jgi:NADP-dependent 3-hydroxy acid dehydrogenase YdfG
MSNNIEGKVVVITGASSGLGEATARLLCAQGASVVLARKTHKKASKAAPIFCKFFLFKELNFTKRTPLR